jgi:hypothetical protein
LTSNSKDLKFIIKKASDKMADDSDDDFYDEAPKVEQAEEMKKEEVIDEDQPMDEESGEDSDDSVRRISHSPFI